MMTVERIDEKCGTTHNMTTLSIFSAVTSFSMMTISVPLNVLIIICIVRKRRTTFKNLFYKMLLNIALADLLTGILATPTSVNFFIKEAKRVNITFAETIATHISVFLTDGVALITMTLLCIDRMTALMFPIKYHKGIKVRTENIIVILTWPLGILFVIPYFELHFIKELAVFSAVNITVAVSSMIITTVVYKTRFQKTGRTVKPPPSVDSTCKKVEFKINLTASPPNSKRDSTSTLVQFALQNNRRKLTLDESPKVKESYLSLEHVHFPCTADDTDERKRRSSTIQSVLSYLSLRNETRKGSVTDNLSPRMNIQRKATRTFMYMLLVFVAAYLPTCVMMIYMNLCVSCDCIVVHIMRDLSIMSILSSSIFRPTSFILSVRHLRKSVFNLICPTRKRE
ncbi:uncharacterized protein LOC130624030 [Hydractinia symbiolongicarpus]|uniref:uncharacterized protein LOC130624030 n=1 Tax=Hydractinia symbiolongicarpus TaxID=13093 RepID=UPI00254D0D7F|nr:uncharacterized protein LOC130624030 [Hydractinia symbiolongicarpus]XP_057295579.1 uncharacterized protein LOC130624030 [Hydractinia symbiolongicarpus]